jgi:hypothetical protein
MGERALPELLAAARTAVGRARTLLGHPRTCNLAECVELFRQAESDLERVRDSLLAGVRWDRELKVQALNLGREIQQAGALLEQAAHFGRRWLERLRASAGYTPAGGPAPLPNFGCVSILG